MDGNEYIDFISALCPVILGYNDPDVNWAVKQQLDNGVLFSLPHQLEIEVSERILDLVPGDMVRFGKNGSDATSGAIRLARAYTGRDHIASCGYHGWQDWSIGVSGRNKGIPQAVRDLTHTFKYNDLESLRNVLERHPNQFAAVIMEPMNKEWPERVEGQVQDGRLMWPYLTDRTFLHQARDLAHEHGALFILDEVITGFRFALGGAQEYFSIEADLACYGKALANGYPLSAIVGKREIMEVMSDIHYSFTNGGELLSLAAAKATLDKLERENVPAYLAELGKDLPGTGHPAWRHLEFDNLKAKTLFLQELHKRGLLCLGTVNLNYSHTKEDVAQLTQALGEWQEGELECEPLKPLFKIR